LILLTNIAGIGVAIATYLLGKESCNIVLVARNGDELQKLQNEYPDRVAYLTGDLADTNLCEKTIDLALTRWGRLDGLIVNHGRLDPVEKILDVNIDDWKTTFDVNVFSAVALVESIPWHAQGLVGSHNAQVKHAIPALRESGGRIILTSSGAAVGVYQGWGAYGASKAVLNYLAQQLAVEEPRIVAVAIRPGTVNTDMQRDIRDVYGKKMDMSDAKKFNDLHETGKLLEPELPGHVIAKLAMRAPDSIRGRFLKYEPHASKSGLQERLIAA